MSSDFRKVSFCTPCMDRLYHLEQTLPKNIANNAEYPEVEFVLLDYNSKDGLCDWVEKHMRSYIERGVLTYYRCNEPLLWHDAHAKNMVLKLASGDIVCNMDADNFTSSDFALFLNEKLSDSNFLVGLDVVDGELVEISGIGISGRFASYKSVFCESGGYNEEMTGWGYNDLDLYKRLIALGYKPQSIELEYLEAICHSDEVRKKNLNVEDIGNYDTELPVTGSNYANYLISESYLRRGIHKVNNKKFGSGLVYRNFSPVPIYT